MELGQKGGAAHGRARGDQGRLVRGQAGGWGPQSFPGDGTCDVRTTSEGLPVSVLASPSLDLKGKGRGNHAAASAHAQQLPAGTFPPPPAPASIPLLITHSLLPLGNRKAVFNSILFTFIEFLCYGFEGV